MHHRREVEYSYYQILELYTFESVFLIVLPNFSCCQDRLSNNISV